MALGSSLPCLCARCDAEAFTACNVAVGDGPHMCRYMVVDSVCPRCVGCRNPIKFLRRRELRRVVIAARLIGDVLGLLRKSQAQLLMGTKPANDRLQLANIMTLAEQEETARAYYVHRVMHAAVEDELTCRRGLLDWLIRREGRPMAGTAWMSLEASEREEARWRGARIRRGLWDGMLPSCRRPHFPDLGALVNTLRDGGGCEMLHANLPMELCGFVQARQLCCHVDAPIQATQAVVVAAPPPCVTPLPAREAVVMEPAVEPVVAEQPQGGLGLSLAEAAEAATELDRQQGAHLNGDTITSSVVVTAPGDHVADNRTSSAEGGLRVAISRFPMGTDTPAYLFSNAPDNLVSAEAMRNVGVGDHKPWPDEALSLVGVVAALKAHIFTPKVLRKSATALGPLASNLPSKLSRAARERIVEDSLDITAPTGVPFSRFVDAFVKSEVTKPRPIANHGHTRLFALAKVAYIFEDVLFYQLSKMCIKHGHKATLIADIFAGLNKSPGAVLENDMSSFEFGICETLKAAEADIIKHIAEHVGVHEEGQNLFERVVDARTKAATWQLRYVDDAGARCCMRITLPRVMRESGDRITSSGNFLQNLLAWMSFLVAPAHMDAAVQSLVCQRGAAFVYMSARSKRPEEARLAFEGDDTVGRLSETMHVTQMEEFFHRWGWRSKIKICRKTGDDFVRFVGFDALTRDGDVVMQCRNPVMCCEIKRVLTTKMWTTTQIPPQDLAICQRAYAATMAEGMKNVEPMYAFFRAMFDDNARGPSRASNGSVAALRDLHFRVHGTAGTDAEVLAMGDIAFPETGVSGNDYRALAAVSAGPFTEAEWSSMSGLTTLEVHGQDLRALCPASWFTPA